ncbi:MAG: nucleoside triphosphate pyrophosphohydrolase [Armatimonadota bacterium]
MGRITIVGLGPGSIGLLSLQTLEVLQQAPRVVLRTARHPAAADLPRYNVRFTSCDDLYERHGTFEEVYQAIVARVLEAAEREDIVYAVPGDPLAAERTVQMLLRAGEERSDLTVEVLPALGAINLMLARLRLDPGDGLLIADARDPRLRLADEAPGPEDHEAFHGVVPLNTTIPTLWLQVDVPLVASHLKLLLLEHYPPEHTVTVLTAVGAEGGKFAAEDEEQVTALPLEELDRGVSITHLTSLYVPPLPWQQRRHTVADLRAIMALLRSDRGCPWDREQDMASLRRSMIEEAYEAAEAIDRDDPEALADELGDLLLNIIFLAQLGMEEGVFDFDDVAQALGDKLIRRHAHVFGEVEADTAGAVLKSWEHIKAGERKEKGEESLFADVPLALPALTRSQKLQKRAARVGFDWVDFRGPLMKLHEEIEELSNELGIRETWERPPILENVLTPCPDAAQRVASAPRARLVHELGDVLFAAVNMARFLHLDAEEAMREANDRFLRRFQRMEAAIHAQGKRLEDLTLEEMDRVWMETKGND